VRDRCACTPAPRARRACKRANRTKPVDFRNGHGGLAAIVERDLGLDTHSGLLAVFRSKGGDRIKALLSDGSGLVLICKRPEQASSPGRRSATR
jgi:transposase